MGKRIVSQARGHGSSTYRVRKRNYKYKISYPLIEKGKGKIVKLIHSTAHSAPLAKIKLENGGKNKIFFNVASDGAYEGMQIEINGDIKKGNISKLKDIEIGTKIFNIENKPGDGGRFVRTGGSFATVIKKEKDDSGVLFPSKKEVRLNNNCRATIGEVAGAGRIEKPFLKAGRKWHLMKAKGRKWHLTSKVKVNAVDHPFGGGRGKRIKSKIAKRDASPGKKVGHIRPRRTGRKKK
jgi:large subunit ribosomal protein L2